MTKTTKAREAPAKPANPLAISRLFARRVRQQGFVSEGYDNKSSDDYAGRVRQQEIQKKSERVREQEKKGGRVREQRAYNLSWAHRNSYKKNVQTQAPSIYDK